MHMKSPYRARAAAFAAAASALALATAASAQTEEVAPPDAYTVTPTGVNLQDGRFTHFTEDLSIGPDGLGMKVRRTYSGLEPTRFSSWMFSFDMRVFEEVMEEIGPTPGTWQYKINAVLGDITVSFDRIGANKDGDYESQKLGWSMSFSHTTDRYTLTDPEGRVYTFLSPGGGIESIVHPNGLREDFTYGTNGYKSVFNNAGYGIIVESDSKICAVNRAVHYVTATSACPATAPTATYIWGTAASGILPLDQFTDASGKTTAYEYDNGAHRLKCIRRPASGPCEITNFYEGNGSVTRYDDRVASQTLATGESYSYSYRLPNPTESSLPTAPRNDRTTVTTPTGTTVTHFLWGSLPTSHTDELGRTTELAYQVDKLSSVTLPEDNVRETPRDMRGNITELRLKPKPGANAPADIVSNFSYPDPCVDPKICDKPIQKTDARGNVTDYTYDPAHGGMLTETGPAVNGVRPQTRYTYEQRYARVKNSSGGWSQEASPIWLLATESRCITGAPHSSGTGCATANDEVVTTYDYGPTTGPNTLLVRSVTVTGPGIAPTRTCHGYDEQGNRISETAPGATPICT